MKNIKTYIATLLLVSLASCEKSNDYYGTPDLSGECTTMATTKTVANFVATSTTTMQQYTTDDVIEAYVTSSDAGGNFYKSISFVSVVDNELKGFSMPIDDYNLYTKFEPGRKVYVNLKDRYFILENGATVVGSRYDNGTPTILTDDEVGRMSGVEYKNILKRSCEKVDEDALVRNVTIAQAKSDTYLNQLVEFDAVQFTNASLGKTYFDASLNNLGSATNHNIQDLAGGSVILRASQYATFASEAIPSGSGKIRGVMTKYGSDYQFMIRTLDDVKLTNGRVQSLFEETFTSNFPNWTTVNVTGTQVWAASSASGNFFAKMSGFSSGTSYANEDWLISPAINLSSITNGVLTFETAKNFTGNSLEVYVSTNYTSGAPSTAAWTQLNPTLSPGSNSYAFISSGGIDISPYAGSSNFRVAFRYTSTTANSATWEVDNVKVLAF